MIDFNTWLEYKGASEGSGRSEKIWLINPKTDTIGLFKYRKSEFTTEHFSEKLASEIAKLIGIEAAEIEIGKYHSRIGTMSYQILENTFETRDDKMLIEGIRLINNFYPEYNKDTLYDRKNNKYYSISMIKKALESYELIKLFDNVLEMMIFDFLIGNTDRHHSNWALVQNNDEFIFCPLYDNGSSLCCYIHPDDLNDFLGNDHQRFMALVDSKSTSRIRINGKLKKEPRHTEVLKYIHTNYNERVIDFNKNLVNILTDKKINELVDSLGKDIISISRKKVIVKYLIEKRKILKNIFEI